MILWCRFPTLPRKTTYPDSLLLTNSGKKPAFPYSGLISFSAFLVLVVIQWFLEGAFISHIYTCFPSTKEVRAKHLNVCTLLTRLVAHMCILCLFCLHVLWSTKQSKWLWKIWLTPAVLSSCMSSYLFNLFSPMVSFIRSLRVFLLIWQDDYNKSSLVLLHQGICPLALSLCCIACD